MYKLYTHNDLDGVGCGILAKLAFGDMVDVRYNSVMGLDYQIAQLFERENEHEYEQLFITDLSINEENTKNIQDFYKNGGKVKLIDHHKTAIHFNDYDWGMVQIEYDDGRLTSATSLFYEYLIEHQWLETSKAIEGFIELVRQYDTWEWDKNDNIMAKQLNDLFFMFSIDEFEENMIERLKSQAEFEFDEFEQKLLAMEEDKIERYVRRKKREIVQTFIGDFCAGVVHAESYHSELGNELMKEFPYLDYIAILNVGGKKISFRTNHDHIDVSAIAGQFGGGGHAKASGCSMSKEAFDLYVQKLFPLETIHPDAFKNKYNLKLSPKGSLYECKKGGKYFIYPNKEGLWVVDKNGNIYEEGHNDFQSAEYALKRKYGVWLVRDDVYVSFLVDFYLKEGLSK
ncbi:DHHA1 domain-containing protein [Bacillus sp. B15-48]|uniref:DHH family phosphoesterase n=1 Tax=Bacillus sp. B15-48 TaxID=1548601 RepID=UPI00193F2CB0|nr:DHHA1 domain-containing protein [Bacillus sp. B15-48]MBM4761993.1 oligoribonuclease [Bacillus sp. B15-48]